MIGISKLYCDTVEPSDALRYGRNSKNLPSHLLQFSEDKKPVVVWNMTKACNLKCVHCYAKATANASPNELSTQEGYNLIDHLAEFGSPVILLSGGEPLTRPDLVPLAKRAIKKKMRAVISTNGTLITADKAKELADIGLSYVGVSLDGLQDTNDQIRGKQGAFQKALEGIKNCQKAGLKVGLRFTITKHNLPELGDIFKLIENENIPRACFYHLVHSGRGNELKEAELSHAQTRETLDFIFAETKKLQQKNNMLEILTVDNHADGPYLYLKLLKERPQRAAEVLELLKMNGGNSSGVGIGAVSWDGTVHPDQFWRQVNLGNIRERSFAEIWLDAENELLKKIKNKKEWVNGRCQKCNFLDVCGGGLRARAEAVTGDTWAPDPACYLSDEEIGI